MIKSNKASMRDVKMIIQKNDLQIAKCKRIKYGSYTVGIMKQGDFAQVDPDKIIMKEYFAQKKKLIKEKQEQLKERLLTIQDKVELDSKRNNVRPIDEQRGRDVRLLDKSQLIKNKLIK